MFDHALSPQQLTVIGALSSGATTTAAAAQAGVHRNTILNWRRNLIPFQHALADAQYDSALYHREKIEEHFDLAVESLRAILANDYAPASVRLKAALAVIQIAVTPPEPKKPIALEFNKLMLPSNPENLHNSAQSTPNVTPTPQPPAPTPEPPPQEPPPPPPPTPILEKVHNPAQSQPAPPQPVQRTRAKVGRNDSCPCGSGLKFKRCCIDRPEIAPAA